MDLFDAILTRTTAGRLAEPGPTSEHLDRMIAAATRAPDHGRLQPWRFFVLDASARERFADAVVEARRRRPPAPTPEQLAVERDKVWRSPTLLVVGCAVHPGHPKVPEIEQVLAVGAGVMNLLNAFHAMGFGAIWLTGGNAYDPRIAAALGFEASERCLGFVYVGTPEAAESGPPRRPERDAVVRDWSP